MNEDESTKLRHHLRREVVQTWIWTVAVAVSLSLSILLSQAMLTLGYWHPEAALLGFALVSMAPLGHHLVRGAR